MGGPSAHTAVVVSSGFMVEPISFRFLLKSFPKWDKAVATIKVLAARREGGIKLQPEILSKIVFLIVSEYYEKEKAKFMELYCETFNCSCDNDRKCICDQSTDEMYNLFSDENNEDHGEMAELEFAFLKPYGLQATFCGPNALNRLIFAPTIISRNLAFGPHANTAEVAPEVKSELDGHYDYVSEAISAGHELAQFTWKPDQLGRFHQLISDYPHIRVLPPRDIKISLLKSGTAAQLVMKYGSPVKHVDLPARVGHPTPAITVKLQLDADLQR